jgi:glycosyl-4,4'-diaponeurosporenoate acyltransferase
MLINMTTPIRIFLDIAAWFLIHIGVSYLINMISVNHFDPINLLFRERKFEKGGSFYIRVFKVKSWKKKLPDGAAIFKAGLPKKHLQNIEKSYIDLFIRETCRAELIHWIIIFISPIFFIWNLYWVGWLMILYAVVVNIPCIITQRYNRIRLIRLLQRRRVT